MALAFGILAWGLTFAGVVAVVLAVSAFVSLAHNDRLSGSAKVMWFLIVALLPIFGSIVYFGVRSDW
jgi:hypothetical protein